jgi:hypothetical protein
LVQLVERLFSKSYLTEAYLNGQKRVDFERNLRTIINNSEKEWVDEKASLALSEYAWEQL